MERAAGTVVALMQWVTARKYVTGSVAVPATSAVSGGMIACGPVGLTRFTVLVDPVTVLK